MICLIYAPCVPTHISITPF